MQLFDLEKKRLKLSFRASLTLGSLFRENQNLRFRSCRRQRYEVRERENSESASYLLVSSSEAIDLGSNPFLSTMEKVQEKSSKKQHPL